MSRRFNDLAEYLPLNYSRRGLMFFYFARFEWKAIELLKKSVNLSKKVGDLVLSEGIYKSFSDNYLALQDWNNYEVYNKLYIETKFAREQSELASLNKSIDVLNQENNKKNRGTKKQIENHMYPNYRNFFNPIYLVSS